MFGLVAAGLLLVAVYVYKYYENVRRYPRGPTPLPLIGNLLKINPTRLNLCLDELQKDYGDVFTVWTPCPIVVLMSYDSMKEAFLTKGDDFAGRLGRFPDDQFMTTDNGGVLFSDGDNWREQRRTAISILRDFGMGKNAMEAQVKSSMDECMRNLDNIKDKSRVDFRWPLQILVANVVNEVLFGYHYKYDDCKRLMDYSDGLTKQVESQRGNPLVFLNMQFPWLEKIPLIGWIAVGQYRANSAKMNAHVHEDVDRCTKTFDDNDEPGCFVHAYMQKMQKDDGSGLTHLQMQNACNDFFLAGMETTSTTLRWAMLYLAKYVDVQDRVRAEIHSVIGKDGDVTMADRVKMPYTAAALTEIQRVANILPLNVMHRTVVDTEVCGHPVPKDTIVLGQIFNVMRNTSVFEQPDEFRPERFLLEDGKTPNKAALEHAVPFSVGKRQCAGEGLARMELFLAIVIILQKYRVLPPKDAPLDLTPVQGIINIPRTNLLQMERA
ncbi:hypothetical protein PRIPAC_76904 [Pristionchus pacificus]|nr:hypothetical protein PRIPAC_76904 [Pristionchus pacificus]